MKHFPTKEEIDTLSLFVSMAVRYKQNVIKSWVNLSGYYIEVKDKPEHSVLPEVLKGGFKAWSNFYKDDMNKTWIIRLSPRDTDKLY